MSIHRYSSRGRTRQPKNLKLSYHTGSNIQHSPQVHFRASGSIDMVAAASSLDNFLTASSTDGAAGYNTENQKYLHLALSQSDAGSFTTSTVTLYGYNRQFGLWGKMKYPAQILTASYAGSGDFGHLYRDITITSEAGTTIYLTIPLNGTDRIAFVGSTSAGLTVYAAGSCD